jgi:dTDP-4-amino-4,6-dideoxygalactose transaminase
MSGKIRLSKSSISQAEKEAVLKVLDKEYLGMGEEVKLFKNERTPFEERGKDLRGKHR